MKLLLDLYFALLLYIQQINCTFLPSWLDIFRRQRFWFWRCQLSRPPSFVWQSKKFLEKNRKFTETRLRQRSQWIVHYGIIKWNSCQKRCRNGGFGQWSFQVSSFKKPPRITGYSHIQIFFMGYKIGLLVFIFDFKRVLRKFKD